VMNKRNNENIKENIQLPLAPTTWREDAVA
jgi:hypothetical protein